MKWINAKDKLPSSDAQVLGYGPLIFLSVVTYRKEYQTFVIDSGFCQCCHACECEVRYWMPIPEVPDEMD